MSLYTKYDRGAAKLWTPGATRILDTLHVGLREVLIAVGRHADILLIEGYRDRSRQEEMAASRESIHEWPNSAHNRLPAAAVDIAPYPAGSDSAVRAALLAGRIMQQGRAMGVWIIWAGDPDGDNIFLAENFKHEIWRHFRLHESIAL